MYNPETLYSQYILHITEHGGGVIATISSHEPPVSHDSQTRIVPKEVSDPRSSLRTDF